MQGARLKRCRMQSGGTRRPSNFAGVISRARNALMQFRMQQCAAAAWGGIPVAPLSRHSSVYGSLAPVAQLPCATPFVQAPWYLLLFVLDGCPCCIVKNRRRFCFIYADLYIPKRNLAVWYYNTRYINRTRSIGALWHYPFAPSPFKVRNLALVSLIYGVEKCLLKILPFDSFFYDPMRAFCFFLLNYFWQNPKLAPLAAAW